MYQPTETESKALDYLQHTLTTSELPEAHPLADKLWVGVIYDPHAHGEYGEPNPQWHLIVDHDYNATIGKVTSDSWVQALDPVGDGDEDLSLDLHTAIFYAGHFLCLQDKVKGLPAYQWVHADHIERCPHGIVASVECEYCDEAPSPDCDFFNASLEGRQILEKYAAQNENPEIGIRRRLPR